ncbi:DNA replication/repair protein RecF [Taklimakanibacter deserti]|uniref:DNA replication/repair protein RecF n=1 Tax=Taklimakanibacter deserti TaxID=2267839 RepID=UPI000E64F52A
MPSAFILTRLTLTDFRNYASLRLDPGSGLVALTGPNGAGKTNLIEAISLLAAGRGLRGALFEDLARQGGNRGWAIAAHVSSPEGETRLGTQWTPEGEAQSQTRHVVINGIPQKSPGILAHHLRVIWLTPAMDRLFAGPASDRRRFLDRLVTANDPEHASRVLVFEKLMRERNLLLEDQRPDLTWLSGLEAQMAEAAAAIAAARLHAVQALQNHIKFLLKGSAFPASTLGLQGDLEDRLKTMPAVQAEDEYRKLLAESRGQDKAAGRTLNGPHRSDLLVTHEPKSMAAALCSTGEQKALLIGLILAQASSVAEESGAAPVLLLDEVAAHLDVKRRSGLFETLRQLGAQSFMTGTDRELFNGLGKTADFLHVEGGIVTRQ